MTSREAKQFSPLALAFMGDAVFEQLCRERLMLTANMPAKKLHEMAVKKVCAEFQASAVKYLLENSLLSEEELDILKRGRNSNGVNAPKHSTVSEYRAATGLESLFGFLHLCGRHERAAELFDIVWNAGEEQA
ncbi:ribonuclease III domain-containing protein [Ruminococcus sp. Marseille-P6503]|uniref:Mini-ribonuclease 3 n=1 Tax=Ruminococcus sp. Marseille-P6503 TaxID=2364796 RepID=UPI001FA9DB17|nr:ribonuclease III domain-containing protein [Ruminococcus sp. Marseille-P6503]